MVAHYLCRAFVFVTASFSGVRAVFLPRDSRPIILFHDHFSCCQDAVHILFDTRWAISSCMKVCGAQIVKEFKEMKTMRLSDLSGRNNAIAHHRRCTQFDDSADQVTLLCEDKGAVGRGERRLADRLVAKARFVGKLLQSTAHYRV